MDAKKAFQQKAKENKWRWTDTVDHPAFQEACIAAINTLLVSLSSAPDMGSASARYWQMEGAKELVKILEDLMDNPRESKPRDHNLNFNV